MNDLPGQASRRATQETATAVLAEPEEVDHGLLHELIGFNLRISYALASQAFTRVFEERELAPIQFAALELIARNPRLSQREIAHHIGSTPTVLVAPLAKLERRGLITRVRSADDRRRSRVELTAPGAAFLEDARRRIRQVEAELTARLTPAERRELLRILWKMTERD